MRKKLIALRKQNSYTQKFVADYIKKSRSTYTMYETGAINPPFEVILKIKSLFKYPGDDLFDNTLN